MTQEKTATELFDKAFKGPRSLRSDAYKNGVLSALKFKCKEVEHIPHQYASGTAEDDAYSSGVKEGFLVYRHATRSAIKGKLEK